MRILLYCLLFIITMQLAAGMGVVPSSKDIMFEPGKEIELPLKILNNNKEDFTAVISVEGELKEYIFLSDSLVEFSSTLSEKIIHYTLRVPDIEKPGLHQAVIIIHQVKTKGPSQTTQISSSLSIISKINIIVPYKDKYAEARLFVSDFERGKASNFAIEVKNLGEEHILNAKATIDIYGPLNNKLVTLATDSKAIETKKTQILTAAWTPLIPPGKYRAAATVIYDGKNAQDQKSFTIGSRMIDINSISVENFKLGSVAQFDILIESLWNEPITGVFADVTISNPKRTYKEFKTAAVDLEPYGKQELKAYWETENIPLGQYNMDIILHYGKETSEETYTITVYIDKITTTPVGKVLSQSKEEREAVPSYVIILALLVFLLIFVNVILLKKVIKK